MTPVPTENEPYGGGRPPSPRRTTLRTALALAFRAAPVKLLAYAALSLVGGGFLCKLAFAALREALSPSKERATTAGGGHFRTGIVFGSGTKAWPARRKPLGERDRTTSARSLTGGTTAFAGAAIGPA